jgi:predicted GTPase
MFKFLDYAPVKFISAKTGAGVQALFPLIREVYEAASRRIPTGELNRWVEQLRFEERKILYATQSSIRPPSFVIFTGGKGGQLHFSHERFLINQLRRSFGFQGHADCVEDEGEKPGQEAIDRRTAAAQTTSLRFDILGAGDPNAHFPN